MMMKKNIWLLGLLGCWMLAACSIDDDKSVYPQGDNAMYLASKDGAMNTGWNGEFAISWLVNGEEVDTTRLQVMVQTNVLSMPLEWLNSVAFPEAQQVTTWDADDAGWDWHFSLTGYSEYSVYFAIKNTQYYHRAMVDGKLLGYRVSFAPEQSTAVYSSQWDSWTAATPIDSIEVVDETIRHNHQPVDIQ